MKTKTITPLDPADFAPEMGNYRPLKPFRYWCQKILPLVYDDSLSYYELLCKVVDYLNKTMEDVETLHGDVTNLNEAYNQLQEYVNNYFSSLDVQKEIDNKLDNMAKNGELTSIFGVFYDDLSERIDALSSRMDSFTKLEEGSTTGDAELVDARTDFLGKTWDNLGDAIRGVTNELFTGSSEAKFLRQAVISPVHCNFFDLGRNIFDPKTVVKNAYVTTNGIIRYWDTTTSITGYIPINSALICGVKYLTKTNVTQNINATFSEFDGLLRFIKQTTSVNTIVPDSNTKFIIVQFSSNFINLEGSLMIYQGEYDGEFVPFTYDFKKEVDPLAKAKELIQSGCKISLIGDSITAGVGSSDYNEDGETIADNWRVNTGKMCYANKLKDYLTSNYGCTVTNLGMKGIASYQILYYWEQLMAHEADLVICMIGTNDRTTSSDLSNTPDLLYKNIETIYNRCKERDILVLFVVAPVALKSNENQSPINFNMNKVEEYETLFMRNYKLPVLSFYEKTSEMFSVLGVTDYSDYYADGLHPNDKLYNLMFIWMCNMLGIGVPKDTYGDN